MHFREWLELAWTAVVTYGFSVLWRTGFPLFLGGLLGVMALLGCHRKLYHNGRLKLGLAKERCYEIAIMALWTPLLPLLGLVTGGLIGIWWAGNYLIGTAHMGERIGMQAFKAIATSVASARLEASRDARAQLADALMKGEQKISVKELSLYTSHHVGEVSAAGIWSHLPFSSQTFQGATVWSIEKTLDLLAYSQLGSEGDVVYKLVTKVTEHDRVSDNDGLVTVEEISEVACKTYGDRGVKGLWAALILHALLPVLLTFALLLLVPVALAWATRHWMAWRARKAARPGQPASP